jgi:hypothetical protein
MRSIPVKYERRNRKQEVISGEKNQALEYNSKQKQTDTMRPARSNFKQLKL